MNNRFEFTDPVAFARFVAELQRQGIAFRGGDDCAGAVLYVVLTGY
jgi:hypothetical protein